MLLGIDIGTSSIKAMVMEEDGNVIRIKAKGYEVHIPREGWAEQPQFETTFILQKDGVTKEFTLDNYPDSTWTFVDSKTVQTSKGYEPEISDLSIVRCNDNEDVTQQILQHKEIGRAHV